MEGISITIKKEQLEWLEDEVRDSKFASISHGIRVAIKEKMEREKHGTN